MSPSQWNALKICSYYSGLSIALYLLTDTDRSAQRLDEDKEILINRLKAHFSRPENFAVLENLFSRSGFHDEDKEMLIGDKSAIKSSECQSSFF